MQSTATLPGDVQQKLKDILAHSPNSITEPDRLFLQARRSYLTPEEQIRFGLAERPQKQEPAATEAPAPKTSPKTSRSSKASQKQDPAA